MLAQGTQTCTQHFHFQWQNDCSLVVYLDPRQHNVSSNAQTTAAHSFCGVAYTQKFCLTWRNRVHECERAQRLQTPPGRLSQLQEATYLIRLCKQVHSPRCTVAPVHQHWPTITAVYSLQLHECWVVASSPSIRASRICFAAQHKPVQLSGCSNMSAGTCMQQYVSKHLHACRERFRQAAAGCLL